MNSSPTPLSPKHPQLSVDAPHAFFPIYIGYCPHCPVDEMGTSNSPICIWNYQSSAFAIWTKILYLSTISQRSKCHSVLRITFRHNALGERCLGLQRFFPFGSIGICTTLSFYIFYGTEFHDTTDICLPDERSKSYVVNSDHRIYCYSTVDASYYFHFSGCWDFIIING